jgi:hypothetical protein
MARAKQASKRTRRRKTLPALGVAGIAGVSFSLAGGASASTGGPVTDIQSQNFSTPHEIFLGEEEISDVSLATFYVFDKENAAKPQFGEKLAWWRGCGGCGRCGGCGWRGCAGCGGCGCCWSWGRCRVGC